MPSKTIEFGSFMVTKVSLPPRRAPGGLEAGAGFVGDCVEQVAGPHGGIEVGHGQRWRGGDAGVADDGFLRNLQRHLADIPPGQVGTNPINGALDVLGVVGSKYEPVQNESTGSAWNPSRNKLGRRSVL